MKNKPRIKIFIVDDDVIYLKTLEKKIKESSYYDTQIIPFYSGEECLEFLHEKPNAIILDYYLPTHQDKEANGLETLKKIKKSDPKLKVIMLSGQDQLAVAVNSIKFGAFDYIVKNETAFVKVQNAINNVVYNNIIEAEAHDNKFWLKIAGFALVGIIISLVASFFYTLG